MYKLHQNNFRCNSARYIKRLANNTSIHLDTYNIDYQEYPKWIEKSNTRLSADKPKGE